MKVYLVTITAPNSVRCSQPVVAGSAEAAQMEVLAWFAPEMSSMQEALHRGFTFECTEQPDSDAYARELFDARRRASQDDDYFRRG